MNVTVTALEGRRLPDGRLEVKGLKTLDQARYETLKRDTLAAASSVYVKLRPVEDRQRLAEEAFFSGHLLEKDEKGNVKLGKDGKPVLKSRVSIPYKTKVDTQASPARMVVQSTIDFDDGKPEKLSIQEAFWILNPDTYGKLVIECDRDGKPVDLTDSPILEERQAKKPGGR